MIHGSEGSHTYWLREHGVPGVLAGVEDVVIGGEHTMAEEVVFELLPSFFGRIAVGGGGRNSDKEDIGRDAQRRGAMPSGAVGDHGGADLRGGVVR